MLYGDPWDLSSSCSQHVLREMHHQSSTEDVANSSISTRSSY